MSAGTFWRYIRHAGREYGRDNCPQLAAAISYYVLFSIVPLTFLLVSVFGLVIRTESLRAEVVQQAVRAFGLERGEVLLSLDERRLADRGLSPTQIAEVRSVIASLTPEERSALADRLDRDGTAPVAGFVLDGKELVVRFQNSVSETLSNVAGASAPLTFVSLLISAWSASAMFGAVRKALNVVWKVEFSRAYLQQKLLDLGMVAACGLLLAGSVVATGGLRALRDASDGLLGPLSSSTSILWSAVAYLLPALLSFAVFLALYRFVPAVRVRTRDVWLGAAVAAILFEVLKNGFAFYVTHFRSYDLLYGSLGGILLFLTLVYFAAAILLLGAEMAAAMPGLRSGAFEPVPQPGRPRVGLVRQARNEVSGFIRSLVWSSPSSRADGEASTPPDRLNR